MELAEKTGNRLRAIRKSKNMSQLEFSEELGVDRSYYAEVEIGNRNPSIQFIAKVIHNTGLTLSDFFRDIENPDSSDGFEVAEPSTEGK